MATAAADDGSRTVSPPVGVKRERSEDEDQETRRVSQRTESNNNANNDEDIKTATFNCVNTINTSTDTAIIIENMNNIFPHGILRDNIISERQKIFIRVGGPLSVVTAMNRFPSNPNVQGSGIFTLWRAMSSCDEAISVVFDVDGAQAILSAMRRFHATKRVQLYGLAAFCRLCANNAPFGNQLVQTLDALPLVTKAVKKFADDAKVCKMGCILFWLLTKVETLKQPMIQAKVASVLSAAIEGHLDNSDIQTFARRAMKALL